MLKDVARDMEDGGTWVITVDKIRVAVIMFGFRKPKLVEIELSTNATSIKQVWYIVTQLVKIETKVHIKDSCSWQTPLQSSTDELLHSLTQPDSRCHITLFN